LYISAGDLKPPINNQLKLNIKYQQRVPLVKNWPADKKPFFKISFAYGNNPNDLTNTLLAGQTGYNQLTTAYNISAQLGNSFLWQLEQDKGVTVWTIVPTSGNSHLFTEANNDLDIYFDHLITNLPGVETTLFIQWGNIPGYNDGWEARNIQKADKPLAKILSFSLPGGKMEGQLKYQEPIRLDWQVFATPKVELSCKEDPSFSQVFEVPANAATAPALRVFPSIIDASSSNSPFAFLTAPFPALNFGESSIKRTISCTTSMELTPPFNWDRPFFKIPFMKAK